MTASLSPVNQAVGALPLAERNFPASLMSLVAAGERIVAQPAVAGTAEVEVAPS